MGKGEQNDLKMLMLAMDKNPTRYIIILFTCKPQESPDKMLKMHFFHRHAKSKVLG